MPGLSVRPATRLALAATGESTSRFRAPATCPPLNAPSWSFVPQPGSGQSRHALRFRERAAGPTARRPPRAGSSLSSGGLGAMSWPSSRGVGQRVPLTQELVIRGPLLCARPILDQMERGPWSFLGSGRGLWTDERGSRAMLTPWPAEGSREWAVVCEGSALSLWSCLGCGQKEQGTGARPPLSPTLRFLKLPPLLHLGCASTLGCRDHPDPGLNCFLSCLFQLPSPWAPPEARPGMTVIAERGFVPPSPRPQPLRTGSGPHSGGSCSTGADPPPPPPASFGGKGLGWSCSP